MKVNVLEAKNRLSQLIKAAEAGEEVVIANRGKPVVRLVPVQGDEKERLPPGHPKRILAHLNRMKDISARSRRTAEEIEAYIQAERDAWD